ncbi:MAG: hypothetical protein KatS3mg121_0664 [Gammaproteobacteria bacterium]|nr:MAG: hypothetical protein KatS3mg121_0664 [Gammaproteobacteria bacterium]
MNTLLGWTEKALLAALVLGLSIGLGALLGALVRRLGRQQSVQRNRVYRLLAGSLNTLTVTVGAVCALGTLGVNVTALIAGLGLTGFALGMALKDAVANLVAGLLIVVYAPFDIDDWIETAGVAGRVADIDLRYVTLQTAEGERILVPNGQFLTSIIRRRPAA